MDRDKLYKKDNVRFSIDGMDLHKVSSTKRDAEMRILLDLLDEFYKHGVKPKCQEGMNSHKYDFGYWKDFPYRKYEEIKTWNISNQTYQRIAPTLMSTPGIFRDLKDNDWNQMSGFKNNCGFSCLNEGRHYSGDVETWHKNRELYFRAHQEDIDWSDRNDFLPNKYRSDWLLQMRIDKFVADSVKEEAQKNKWSKDDYEKKFLSKCEEFKDKLDKNVGVTFHYKVMNDKNGTLRALADQVGTQICETNFYIYEEQLTKDERKVSGSPRKIFSIINKNGAKQYISIDLAHGMLEFHNHKGEHLGEFRFNGLPNKKADPTHNLKTI